MYNKILVPLDNSKTDQVILQHIRGLASLTKAQLILVHVADGFVARHKEMLNLADSPEIHDDRAYLAGVQQQLKAEGFSVETILETGDPAKQILKVADERQVDLVAMATHGHGPVGDFILGSVADQIRHRTNIPVLLIRAE